MKLRIKEDVYNPYFDDDEDFEYAESSIKPIYGYRFYNQMTDDTFFVLSNYRDDCKTYGDLLRDIYRIEDEDERQSQLDDFIVPPSVIVTDPEIDECKKDRTTGKWTVEMDGGYGDTYEVDLIGEFRGRF